MSIEGSDLKLTDDLACAAVYLRSQGEERNHWPRLIECAEACERAVAEIDTLRVALREEMAWDTGGKP